LGDHEIPHGKEGKKKGPQRSAEEQATEHGEKGTQSTSPTKKRKLLLILTLREGAPDERSVKKHRNSGGADLKATPIQEGSNKDCPSSKKSKCARQKGKTKKRLWGNRHQKGMGRTRKTERDEKRNRGVKGRGPIGMPRSTPKKKKTLPQEADLKITTRFSGPGTDLPQRPITLGLSLLSSRKNSQERGGKYGKKRGEKRARQQRLGRRAPFLPEELRLWTLGWGCKKGKNLQKPGQQK